METDNPEEKHNIITSAFRGPDLRTTKIIIINKWKIYNNTNTLETDHPEATNNNYNTYVVMLLSPRPQSLLFYGCY